MKKTIAFALSAALLFGACGVKKEVHQKALADLKKSRSLNQRFAEQVKKDKKAKADHKKEIADLRNDNEKLGKEIAELKKNFFDAMDLNESMKKKIERLGSSVEDLSSAKSELNSERERLMEELAQLRKLKESAEKRNQEYGKLMSRLKKMIDAGSLSVKIRKGRMIVSMSSDILFKPGRANLTDEGESAIVELSATLKELEGRSFLVVGHSDSTPIRTKRFPSNWELSSQRAIEVVRILTENGVDPRMLQAAGAAEFDPIAENDTKENKQKNRRVEIVFLPKIEELPGFTPVK